MISAEYVYEVLYEYFTEADTQLISKLEAEKKDLNPPVYGGPMIFEKDHDLKAGWNKALDKAISLIKEQGGN